MLYVEHFLKIDFSSDVNCEKKKIVVIYRIPPTYENLSVCNPILS